MVGLLEILVLVFMGGAIALVLSIPVIAEAFKWVT